MSHDHSHSHDHHDHHHVVELKHVSRAFVIGIVLNIAFVIAEAVAGLYIHSLSLLSDAGHNLADVATLALALLAFRLAKVQASDQYTYGYRKTSILVALFNSIVLLVAIGAICYEAVQRLIHPEPLPGVTISVIAGIGILINGGTALLFMADKDKDLNVKSAYLHMAADALVSLALVIGGVIIYFTQWYIVDTILSIGVAVVILFSTWSLLKDSLRLSLDGVPDTIRVEEVKHMIRRMNGVSEVHHVHIWAISTTLNALTAHIVLEEQVTPEAEARIKHDIRHQLEHISIHHATLETERVGQACDEKVCHQHEGV
ncbi:MAG: cation transporter [Bacteroidetes bacterium]|nr:cation transporter [Bacteroidota bacterium]